MSDDKHDSRLNFDASYQMEYGSQKFGRSTGELKAGVKRRGEAVNDVEAEPQN